MHCIFTQPFSKMGPQIGEQSVTDKVGMTRIKCSLPVYPSSSASIPIQLDLVTPAVVLDAIPQTDTIRESKLFRDVEAFIGRHFASLEVVKETNYFDKMMLNGTLCAKFGYYFASSYGGSSTIGLTCVPSSRPWEKWK